MKFAFVTCVQIGLSCMEAIYQAGGKLSFAVSLEDHVAPNKSGRVFIDGFCDKHDIDLLKVSHVNDTEVLDAIEYHQIDWLFIIGWSQIAGETLINAPKKGVLGMHPTLLPIGRGRAAIPWAILKGLSETGVTLFKLDNGVDTGPILYQEPISLAADVDATSLYEKVDETHVTLMKKVIPALLMDDIEAIAQDDSLATVWPGRRPEDGEININGSVYEAERLVRAVTRPYPGAYAVVDGTKYVIWKARIVESCNENCITLKFSDGILECTETDVFCE